MWMEIYNGTAESQRHQHEAQIQEYKEAPESRDLEMMMMRQFFHPNDTAR